ncbi:uncharacterized protein LOC135947817 [Cloeon dipterum]|uniref:uncharacterized protein LOC135947817 n=1 Tax=Cloeon dipterum TaxID=197152 RepID=UPI0032200A32
MGKATKNGTKYKTTTQTFPPTLPVTDDDGAIPTTVLENAAIATGSSAITNGESAAANSEMTTAQDSQDSSAISTENNAVSITSSKASGITSTLKTSSFSNLPVSITLPPSVPPIGTTTLALNPAPTSSTITTTITTTKTSTTTTSTTPIPCLLPCKDFDEFLLANPTSKPSQTDGSILKSTKCGNRQYYVSTAKMSRNEAGLRCKAMDMSLLTVTSIEELTCLSGLQGFRTFSFTACIKKENSI